MPDFEEPADEYFFDLYFNWAVPPLHDPPDLLVLATDLAGLGGMDLPIEVSAVDSYSDVMGSPERRLQVTGTSQVSLAGILMGREQLCEVLDSAREVSEYLLDRVSRWMELPGT
jgi:hypothetical protein